MSGHSKWATIKRAKGKTDAARANVFTKIGRELAVAVKAGGADPNSNARLRDVIAKAKSANMPNDNIQRSIKKASGELNTINYEPITYEGYGPCGIAMIVEALTDNKNRTAADVRHIFDKNGGSMGTTGCVSYMFDTRGVLIAEKQPSSDDDEMMMLALECGAEDFDVVDGMYEILTSPSAFTSVREELEKNGVVFLRSEIEKVPQNSVVPDGDALVKFRKMLDMFDDNDDVQQVFHNAELPFDDEE